MTAVLLWLVVQIITKLSEKWKVSQTYVSIWLALLLWVGYYVATNYYSIQRQQAVEWFGWVYASSQIFYNLFKKLGIID